MAAHQRLRRRAGRTPAAAVVDEFAVPPSAAHGPGPRSGWGSRWCCVALIAFTLLRLPAALVTVAALGLPFLFLIYLRETDAFRDYPPAIWCSPRRWASGSAVGWVLLTGAPVARSYGIALGTGIVGAECCATASASRWAE